MPLIEEEGTELSCHQRVRLRGPVMVAADSEDGCAGRRCLEERDRIEDGDAPSMGERRHDRIVLAFDRGERSVGFLMIHEQDDQRDASSLAELVDPRQLEQEWLQPLFARWTEAVASKADTLELACNGVECVKDAGSA
jgi:hypothetical protein